MTNKTLKEKIEKILDPLYRYVEGEGVEWGDQEIDDILSLVYSHLEKKMPKMKTNEWWMKELDVPCSDYSYGHEHGYSICLSEIKQILKEELLDPKK